VHVHVARARKRQPTADEVWARARALAGLPLSRLPGFGVARGKGAVGDMVERALGIERSASSPDVPTVEVKTLPLVGLRAAESTWVCRATPSSLQSETWSTSRVRRKLARVLFVPIDRVALRVGTAFLWSPTEDEERMLRADWEDLADLVARGLGFAVSARRGRALQLRPKAPHAGVTRAARELDGTPYRTAPQAFYLRRTFVQRVVEAALADPARW
jgi:DNA mismatch repair protein MutH